MKTEIEKIDVNEMKEMIEKAYGYKSVIIKAVDVADADNQYSSEYKIVGVGGILTLYVEVEK